MKKDFSFKTSSASVQVRRNTETESRRKLELLIHELEQIQNKAAHIVTGATRIFSINSFLTETGWETLSVRRSKHKLTFFYKMGSNLSPEYLSSLVPTNVMSN